MNRPLCCFVHPKFSNEPRSFDDRCPDCGRTYGFPLTHAPEFIGEFKVVQALSRGFYSAVYQVTYGALDANYVLKVAPKKIYETFKDYGKDFEHESRIHRAVAVGSDHLVGIHDIFDLDVTFGDLTMPCHVAQLDYIEGTPLEDVLGAEPPPSSRTVAQIVLDLLQLLEELQAKESFHNDLHGSNIIVQTLPASSRRAEALDDSIRVIAVDLGSVTDGSKSDTSRLGDLHSIGRYSEAFASRLIQRPGETADIDYRLAGQLQEIAALLAPEAVNQRPPEFAVLRDRIRYSYGFIASPWKNPPPLRRFDDSYNAQTLHPWFVPKLLVDPDGDWLEEIRVQGPQVISGMRGCGKTMLLRSLTFHARAAAYQDEGGTQPIGDRLAADRFVGLYVSCNRLLDLLGRTEPPHLPEARLFVAFAREALRAIRHLREIDSSLPSLGAARSVGEVLTDYVKNVPADLADDEWALERLTLRILASLQRGESKHQLTTDPSAAFVALAEAMWSCSTIWAGSPTFFLLDDVSTRHLSEESIQRLVSRLVFSSEVCAFKMTTEHQTLEYVLKSPGLIEHARPGRDYKVFDLGARVNERMKMPLEKGGGSNFIRDILALRAAQYPTHPTNVSPADLLGNTKLTSIAQNIANSSATSSERKQLYYGLRALTAVCVGDVGDVLAIYESMLRRSGGDLVPIPPRIQHQAFQDYCAERLYHVNHRDGRFKDFAVGFAQAARDLLVASAGQDRLRQYSSVYVRVTTDDSELQFEELRKLIDAGVFVLQGGAPRAKTRDGDPVQKFILKYRKLFGLSSFIGLSDRDRFELSGEDLREWLSNPKRSKEILMRNLGGPLENAEDPEAPLNDEQMHRLKNAGGVKSSPRPQTLFESQPHDEGTEQALLEADLSEMRTPTVRKLTPDELRETNPRSLVLGLGFEARTLESTKQVLSTVSPDHAMLVRYQEQGYGEEIQQLVANSIPIVDVVDYSNLSLDTQPTPPPGPTLVDVTGLAKPLIFQTIRQALVRDTHVLVAHTQAERHYPLDEKIEPILNAEAEEDIWGVLEGLDEVWLGEMGPYAFEPLLLTDADESRRRYLVASASPKHQRLLSLVEERDFDRIDVLAPPEGSPRSDLARRAARVASRVTESSEIIDLDTDDLSSALNAVASAHHRYYINGNYNFELGLTGSKLHAVAFAAASASMRMSQAWYVKPTAFDPDRFSVGVGRTRYFEITMPASPRA